MGEGKDKTGGLFQSGEQLAGTEDWRQTLITDPQTRGGLLVACAPDTVPQVMASFQQDGFSAVVIGELSAAVAGQAMLRVA